MRFIHAGLAGSLLSVCAATALALPTTYSFSGKIVESTGLNGQFISGSFTFDPAKPYQVSRYDYAPRNEYGLFPLSAEPSDGEPGVTLSRGPDGLVATYAGAAGAAIQITKDDGSPPQSEYRLKVSANTAEGQAVTFVLRTFTDTAPSSTIFPSSAPDDMSFDQPAVFNAPGTTTTGWLNIYDQGSGLGDASATFTLEDVAATPQSIPTLPFASSFAIGALAPNRAAAAST